ncbi:hypothetical protein ACF08N_35895 [Streptomyces sp. NPDC015127]|uniref:hypothetical protein n=1 Tax=Streptomyces sp. NPDC015127 TaxID=3364939 RepID=UPI003700E783
MQRILTVAGASAAALMLTATTASAVTFEVDLATASPVPEGNSEICAEGGWYTGDDSHRTIACFMKTGDWFHVVDQKADGYSAVALWQVTDPRGAVVRQGSVWNASGYDTHRYKNKDLPEGYDISIRACVGNWKGGDSPSIVKEACSAWKFGTT